MKNKAESTAQSMFNFFCGDIFLYLITFVGITARLKIYEVNDYGFWRLAQSLVPIVSVFIACGLPLYLLITIPKLDSLNRPTEIKDTIKKSIILIICANFVVISLSIIIILTKILPGNYLIPVTFLPLLIISASLNRLINNIFVALRKSKIVIGFNFLNLIFAIIISLGIYLVTRNIAWTLVCFAVGALVITIVQVFYVFKLLPKSKGVIASERVTYFSLFSKAINYGKWIIPSSLMWAGYSSIPLWIASSKNLAEVASIGFAIVVSTAFFVPFTRISDVFLQKISRERNENVLETIYKTKEGQNILLPFYLVSLSLFIIFIFLLIKLLFWEKYGNAVPYTYILLSSMPFLFLFYLMKNVPITYEKIKLANIPEYIAFPIFLASLYPLYHLIGTMGIVISLFLARFFIVIFILLFYKRYSALSYKWTPFLILIPLSLLTTYNYLWSIPYIVSLIFLLVNQREVIYKYWNFAKLQILPIKHKISALR